MVQDILEGGSVAIGWQCCQGSQGGVWHRHGQCRCRALACCCHTAEPSAKEVCLNLLPLSHHILARYMQVEAAILGTVVVSSST
jgi:long-subunit acyl-CoA synthetase (AMP-forming)